jgi:hypothetical protein
VCLLVWLSERVISLFRASGEAMSGTWRKLERKTLFVSCSMDMDAEAVVVRNVLDELNQRLPPEIAGISTAGLRSTRAGPRPARFSSLFPALPIRTAEQ